jgi:hypothetical protein
VAHFRALIAALEQGPSLPPEVAAWLHDGAVRLAAGDVPDLSTALGLRGRGLSHAWAQTAIAERNAALRRAFDLCPGATPAVRLNALAAKLRRFPDAWRRVQHDPAPPGRFTSVQVELFWAYKAYDSVPCSRSQLRRIVS